MTISAHNVIIDLSHIFTKNLKGGFHVTTPFEKALYSQDSIPKVIEVYSNMLRQEGSNQSLLHANKILEYKNIISTRSHATLRKVFDNFYTLLNRELPDLRFRISGRRKSLISVEQKIQRNLELNKSLDLIRDMLGVRIILLNGTSELCYTVLEKLIQCCLEDGFTICEENSHNSEKETLQNHSLVLSTFNYGITDYISVPKETGYQSLHATFRNSSGFCFEVQVRTFGMHCAAVNGVANHSDYKNTKYKTLEFDRSKIIIPGYSLCPNGDIMDLVGLEHALEIIQRNKSF